MMQTEPKTPIPPKSKIALWLIALACASAVIEYGSMLLAPLFSNTVVVGPAVIVVPIVGLIGAVSCFQIIATGQIPKWIWKSQRAEFERLIAKPNQFLGISIFVSLVLFAVATGLLVAILTGNF